MSEINYDTYVVVGLCETYGQKHREVVLITVQERVDSAGRHFSVCIDNPTCGPRLNVSVTQSRIQITESTEASRILTLFQRNENDCWHFDCGSILTIKNGWAESWVGTYGSVLFDSSKVLDRILQAGDRHEDTDNSV